MQDAILECFISQAHTSETVSHTRHWPMMNCQTSLLSDLHVSFTFTILNVTPPSNFMGGAAASSAKCFTGMRKNAVAECYRFVDTGCLPVAAPSLTPRRSSLVQVLSKLLSTAREPLTYLLIIAWNKGIQCLCTAPVILSAPACISRIDKLSAHRQVVQSRGLSGTASLACEHHQYF